MVRNHRHLICLLLVIATASSGCHKKAEKPKKSAKLQREDAIQQASDEQTALNKFVASVREILAWNQSQPVATEAERQQTVKALAQKLEQVPAKGLPEELSNTWQTMLKAWKELAKNPSPDATLRDQGAKAADELNRQLAARGVSGFRF